MTPPHAIAPAPPPDAPWRDGPPRFDVGLSPIDPARWLAPDDQAAWLPTKNALIDRDPAAVFAALPEADAAQAEAARMIRAVAPITPARPGEPPLLTAARAVSDDLVVMLPVAGEWVAGAACLCSPTFFSVSHAIGRPLGGLHAPVPGGDPGLSNRIGRVFSMLREELTLERLNWTVQWGPERHTPDGAPLRAAARRADSGEARAMLHQRVERQTIRRLPATGATLFTIRVRLTPLADLLVEPADRAAFARAWIEAPEAVRNYKRWDVLDRHVHALLGCHP